jgi:hypothetical protein
LPLAQAPDAALFLENRGAAMIARTPTSPSAHAALPRTLAAGLIALVLQGGTGVAAGQGPDGPGPGASLELSSYAARATPAQRLTLDVSTGDAEVYHLLVTYPPGFRFRGVQTGAVIGAYELDLNADGSAERVAALRALGSNVAFADVIADGTFTPALEPGVSWNNGTVEVRLPFGGDARADTITAPFNVRVTLVLAEGLVTNPAIGGTYPVAARITDVDPDTDGTDDGHGQSPAVRTAVLPLAIDGPLVVPFARLVAEKFHLTPRSRGDGDFLLLGRFVLGRGSNGLDLRREDLSLVVGGFRQTVPGRSFRKIGPLYLYLARGPGIATLIVAPDGTFLVEARDLLWNAEWERDPRGLELALRIGSDEGTARIDLRRHHGPF